MPCPSNNYGKGCNSNTTTTACCDKFGCCGVCPDFSLKRNDTKPPFKVSLEDCDGPVDLSGLVIEANMWAKAKLKKNIDITDNYFQVADDIGFEQMMVGDIIIFDRVRQPEHMLVTGFDEVNRFVQVQRGYNGTVIFPWKKGTGMRIMKMMNAPAESETVYTDITEIDGTTRKNVITESFLVYQWQPGNVCLPGCYYLEFKVIKMADVPQPSVVGQPGITVNGVIPSFTQLTPADYCCTGPPSVEWMRRYPVSSEGYVIQIMDSPTCEFAPPGQTPPSGEVGIGVYIEPTDPDWRPREPGGGPPEPYYSIPCEDGIEANR